MLLNVQVAEAGRAYETGGREALGAVLSKFQQITQMQVVFTDAQGTDLPLTSYRHGVQEVAGCLEYTGFKIYATVLRAPELEDETTSQGFVIACSPLS